MTLKYKDGTKLRILNDSEINHINDYFDKEGDLVSVGSIITVFASRYGDSTTPSNNSYGLRYKDSVQDPGWCNSFIENTGNFQPVKDEILDWEAEFK